MDFAESLGDREAAKQMDLESLRRLISSTKCTLGEDSIEYQALLARLQLETSKYRENHQT